jgi:hypothetical protein
MECFLRGILFQPWSVLDLGEQRLTKEVTMSQSPDGASANRRSVERTKMLSEQAVALLERLPYRHDAEWQVNILPFGSIYWTDEMPSLHDLVDKLGDMLIIHAMFGIRLKLWDGEALDAQDQRLWDGVKGQVPNWALFHRLNLNDEQKQARKKAERQVEEEFESLSDDSGNAPER